MRFIVNKDEFDFVTKEKNSDVFELNSSTSVNELKAHFFVTLKHIGDFIIVNKNTPKEELNELASQNDVIWVSFHEEPFYSIPCRLLQHTKGGLMLLGGFNCGWTFFRNSTLNIVTTQIQKEQLIKTLGRSAPKMGVFTPSLNENVFNLNDSENKDKGNYLRKDVFKIIYAGRFVANKGIIQLTRSLDLWPMDTVEVTLMGKIEKNFHISQSNALHVTFEDYFRREVIDRNHSFKLRILPAMNQEGLSKVYQDADCFVYPTFHEDENFGMAPREAMLCGLPFVVSDFCGLSQLSPAKGGLVRTYPSLGGVRFSLKELRDHILSIQNWSFKEKVENRLFNSDFVKEECNPQKSLESLRKSVEELLQIPPSPPPDNAWRSKDRIDKWDKYGPESFKKSISLAGQAPPSGLYVDGDGYASDDWYSEPHFFKAIQSIYTTFSETPHAIKGKIYRGFWRIGIWSEEKAIVEFGFPGPRLKRYNSLDWNEIIGIIRMNKLYEPEFIPHSIRSIEIINELVELGYLVPDEI